MTADITPRKPHMASVGNMAGDNRYADTKPLMGVDKLESSKSHSLWNRYVLLKVNIRIS